MKSPIEDLAKKPRRSSYVSDLPVARTIRPSNRRAKLVTISLMLVAAAATGVFVQLKLAHRPDDGLLDGASMVARAEAAKADIEAPVKRHVVEPVTVKTIAIIPANSEGEANEAGFDGEVDPGTLAHNNPRWVRVDRTPAAAFAALDQATAAAKKAQALPIVEPVAQAFATPEEQDLGSDEQSTAAIPPVLAAAKSEPVAARSQPVAGDGEAKGTVRVQRAVNLRAAPVSGSRVIKVLRAGSVVGFFGCKGWCEVTHEGTRGFIYKSFIQGSERQAAAAAQPAGSEPEKPEKPVKFVENPRDVLVKSR